jgi:glycerol-3-phosphate dehydrogenase
VLDLEHDPGGPPLMNVFGGKITTHRRLSEHALQKLKPYFPAAGGDWTAKATLPGGDMPGADFASFLAERKRRFAWLPAETVHRLARAYGTRMDKVLGESRSQADLGRNFGGDLYEREVEYLIAEEWAVKAQDVLWRRSKLGLHLGPEAEQRLAAWLASRGAAKDVGLAAAAT